MNPADVPAKLCGLQGCCGRPGAQRLPAPRGRIGLQGLPTPSTAGNVSTNSRRSTPTDPWRRRRGRRSSDLDALPHSVKRGCLLQRRRPVRPLRTQRAVPRSDGIRPAALRAAVAGHGGHQADRLRGRGGPVPRQADGLQPRRPVGGLGFGDHLPRPATPPGATGEDHIQSHRREMSNRMAEDLADAVRQFDRECAQNDPAAGPGGKHPPGDRPPAWCGWRGGALAHHGLPRFDEKPAVYEKFVKPIIEKHFREQVQSRKMRLRRPAQAGLPRHRRRADGVGPGAGRQRCGDSISARAMPRWARSAEVRDDLPNARKECPYCTTVCHPGPL